MAGEALPSPLGVADPPKMYREVKHPILVKYALSTVGATCAESLTYPIDVIKVRLQLQGDRPVKDRKTKNSLAKRLFPNRVYEGQSPSGVGKKAAPRMRYFSPGARRFHRTPIIHSPAPSGASVVNLGGGKISAVGRGPLDSALAGSRSLSSTGVALGGKKARAAPIGFFSMTQRIIEREGFSRLYYGISAAFTRHAIYTGLRMNIYEILREQVFTRDENGYFAPWKAALCGMVTGVTAQFICSPTDLVKIQLSTDGLRVAQGLPPRHSGMVSAIKTIVGESGPLGLWRGVIPNIQRAALVNVADIATYDLSKVYLREHYEMKGMKLVFGSSLISGLAAAVISTPVDTLKSRMMAQVPKADGTYPYASTLDCARSIVRRNGFWALYRGFGATYLRATPWSCTFWMVFETLRDQLGLAPF